jgi:hypothetical protein
MWRAERPTTIGCKQQGAADTMPEPYELEKPLWSDADWERLGWHDVHIWGMDKNSAEDELLFDMDYLFKWVEPAEGERAFRFWIAPVTLVFTDAIVLENDIDPTWYPVEISELHRDEFRPSQNGDRSVDQYEFECHVGSISFLSTGFRMYVRRKPVLQTSQILDAEQRGGVSFGRGLDA